MYQVSDTKEGREVMLKLRDTYDTLSEMDLMEETFAKLFSGYIMNNYNPNVGHFFQEQDQFFKQATKILFNTKVDNIKSFYGKSIETIFRRFSSDVAWLLQQKGLDFSSTITGRKYSNWISKQINDGKIIKRCNG